MKILDVLRLVHAYHKVVFWIQYHTFCIRQSYRWNKILQQGIFAADIAILSYHHMLWFHTKSSKWPPTVAKGVESKSLHLHSGRSILWGHNKKCTDTTNTKCKISRVTHRQQTDVENGYHKEEKTNRNQD